MLTPTSRLPAHTTVPESESKSFKMGTRRIPKV